MTKCGFNAVAFLFLLVVGSKGMKNDYEIVPLATNLTIHSLSVTGDKSHLYCCRASLEFLHHHPHPLVKVIMWSPDLLIKGSGLGLLRRSAYLRRSQIFCTLKS